MNVSRSVRLAVLGALAGLLTWLVSEPFARTAANHGVRAGSVVFSVGSFYGWFAHATLGAAIVGLIVLSVSWERTRPARALLTGLAGLVLGAFLGWASDAGSDRLGIHLMRGGAAPSLAVSLLWNFAVSLSLALGIAVCAQPTLARVGRIMVGGVAAGFASFVARTVVSPLAAVAVLVRGGQSGWEPFDVTRLCDHVVMGLVLGLCVGLGETLLTSARVRLVLGRNEGREFLVGGAVNRIGSAEGVEIPLFGDPAVASIHAHLWQRDGRWWIQDLGAPAGTLVNGQRVVQAWLGGGETIQVGPFLLQFLLKGQPSSPLPAPVVPTPSVPPAVPVRVPTVAHRLIDPFGAILDLPEGPTTLGRDPSASIRLAHDGLISRLHARVVVKGSQAVVEDLGSRNGTLVNDVPIVAPTALSDGDRLKFGATSMTYRVG